jgi:hypothetical protein
MDYGFFRIRDESHSWFLTTRQVVVVRVDFGVPAVHTLQTGQCAN